jgi:hypothetical protein
MNNAIWLLTPIANSSTKIGVLFDGLLIYLVRNIKAHTFATDLKILEKSAGILK